MKIMSLTDNEIFYINLEYNSKELYESFIDLPIGFLENLPHNISVHPTMLKLLDNLKQLYKVRVLKPHLELIL